MNITQIKIKKLFDLYDHEIKLNSNERITIIYGPNGVGKTIILQMLRSIFNTKYDIFYKVPFEEFLIEFDNGNVLFLKKIYNKDKNQDELILNLNGNEATQIQLDCMPDTKTFDKIIRNYPNLKKIEANEWLDLSDGEILNTGDVLDRYDICLPEKKNGVGWFNDIKEKINVDFIETQRLIILSNSRKKYPTPKTSIKKTVSNYSSELSKEVQRQLAKYATLSQSLDRSFPIRLAKKKTDVDYTDLEQDLSKLEERRKNLIQIGVLDADYEFDYLTDIPEVNQENAHVLSVYIEDVGKKLDVFNDLTIKLNLFVSIINNRFVNKRLSVSKDKGFVIKTSNEREIQPRDLSSGEQHELVLYYELLFKIEPGSLILIDEPEISLHIGWQNEFLNDLMKVIDLAGFDVLIATHSPDIIGDRWDLTVPLEAKVEN
ncbi:AAA family ATPase [Methanolobus sp.]|jgi:predicted ATP-binding protein involved in virulence|uniref:AAA family ATPase n=1 Tax=Methanolobus sp. TaxID=1874737 RepID=UPI0025EF1E3A|nr:AAA family ATPase [Methanolobus sp.]